MDTLGNRNRPGVRAEVSDRADVSVSLRGPKSGLLACLILAFLGFGGGLFIALVGFNSPPGQTAVVAPPQPELLYLPPPEKSLLPANRSAEPLSTARELSPRDERGAVQALALAPDRLSENVEGTVSLLGPAAHPSSAEMGFEFAGVSVGGTAAGYHQLNLGTPALGRIAKGDFAALKAASVPEPTTVALVSISAALLAVARFRRNRN